MSISKRLSHKAGITSLDLHLFEYERLVEVGGTDRALATLAKAVSKGRHAQILDSLLSKAVLFEFVFSATGEHVAAELQKFILDNFPATASDFAASDYATTLPRLSSYLYFLNVDTGNSGVLTDCYQATSTVPGVLKGLCTAVREEPRVETVEDEDDGSWSVRKKRSQKQSTQHKKSKKRPSVLDSALNEGLRKLGKDYPSTRTEADSLVTELLGLMKSLLKFMLGLLRDPELENAIRESYLVPPATSQPSVSKLNIPTASEETLHNHRLGIETTDEAVKVVQKPPSETRLTFPSVQPLRAALHFDNVTGFGNWQVFLSTKIEKHLREHRKNMKIFKIIVKKIKELSQGHFSSDNQKRLKGPDSGIPIFEAKMTGDLRLVYQVDCISDYESEAEWQVLRLFGVFSHAQMDDRMWESLSAQLAGKGPEYRRRVIARSRPIHPRDNVYEPLSWPEITPAEDDTKRDFAMDSLIDTNDLAKIHQWLVLEKYSAFSQALLNCILIDKDASAVFSVSPYEREIIENVSSCFVLGRSGTGKTTTMVFKIFGIERLAGLQQLDGQKKVRQVFVTQSRVLAGRVKEYYDKLTDFLDTASKSLSELKEIQDKVQDVQQGDDLYDPEDDEKWRGDLPKRFSELRDKDFPLFLTFDKLCRLLEADQGLDFARQNYTREHRRAERRFRVDETLETRDLTDPDELGSAEEYVDLRDLTRTTEASYSSQVTYDAFCTRYWPHFPQKLTKGLDTALVYNEILGVIKGSEGCYMAETPHLSRGTYAGLSERTQFTFATQRDRIYDLFESYQRLKSQYGDYDAADRTHAIIHRLSNIQHNINFDYLYVDEAQDNMLIDALLMRTLCTNPRGLFWAGDTAQTIAVGSSFRFNDLKSCLHNFEVSLQEQGAQPSIEEPKFFQLTTNYRSHGGIVNCAEMVIRLIKHFWPNSIDSLRQEKGLVDGDKPIFINGWNDTNARYEQFLLGENGNSIEFGAQQCILVRNDLARSKLREQVGEIGVILTLYESKGLEFDDVLLYDFFEDSPCDVSRWRVVLNYETGSDAYDITPPTFNNIRHAGICTELKFLYVAMTRARKNLWILDRSEKAEPMKRLLLKGNRIELCTPDVAPKLSVASSEKEWEKTGKKLFQHQRYSQAMRCFERAGLSYEKSIAEAYSLRQQARSEGRETKNKRIYLFSAAARAFKICATSSQNGSKRRDYHGKAGDCFQEADEFGNAAREYLHGEEYGRAAQLFRRAGMFDDAVDVALRFRERMEVVIAERIIDASRLHYFHGNMIEKAFTLFDSTDEGLDFMEELGLDETRGKVLERLGRAYEAVELYLSAGRREKAIEVLLSGLEDNRCLEKATQILLSQLWKRYAFGHELDYVKESVGYESLSEALAGKMNAENVKEADMFSCIKDRDPNKLLALRNNFLFEGDKLHATLVLDHFLRDTRNAEFDTAETLLQYIQACTQYTTLIKSLWEVPHSKPKVQKLLGFIPAQDDSTAYEIEENSMLLPYALKLGVFRRRRGNGVVVHEMDMPSLIKSSLTGHLVGHFQSRCEKIWKASGRFLAMPCRHHVDRGICQRDGCHQEHIDASKIDHKWFNYRVRILYSQILYLQAVDPVLNYDEKRQWRDKYLKILYEICHPTDLNLGSMENISHSLIPEARPATQTISQWLEDVSYNLKSSQSGPLPPGSHGCAHTFLDEVVVILTLGRYYDPIRFREIVPRSVFFDGNAASGHLQRQLGAGYMYIIHDLWSFMDAAGPHFIRRGISFVRHVIATDLAVAVDHLCCLLEHICSCCIVIHKYHQQMRLHNCTLPKSWLKAALSKLGSNLHFYEKGPIWSLLEILFEFIRLISVPLAYVPKRLKIFNIDSKNLAIDRLCKCIILLGYNVNHPELRHDIVTYFNAFADLSYPWSMQKYVFCRGWSDLARIVHRHAPRTGLDSLVTLVLRGVRMNPLPFGSTIERIRFATLNDLIVPLLQAASQGSLLSATAAPFVPREVPTADQAPTDTVAVTQDVSEVVNLKDIEDEDEDDEIADIATDRSAEAEAEVESLPVVSFTVEEMDRVICLQKRYKTLVRRRATLASVPQWWRDMYFNLYSLSGRCLALNPLKEWRERGQKIMFLGLLPHILLCMGILLKKLEAEKKRGQDMIRGVTAESHMEYDKGLQQMSQTRERRKRLNVLQRIFDPKSDWHAKHDFSDLQAKLRDLESLINDLKLSLDPAIEENLALAKKAILQERKVVVQKEQKPCLNTEDIYDFEGY